MTRYRNNHKTPLRIPGSLMGFDWRVNNFLKQFLWFWMPFYTIKTSPIQCMHVINQLDRNVISSAISGTPSYGTIWVGASPRSLYQLAFSSSQFDPNQMIASYRQCISAADILIWILPCKCYKVWSPFHMTLVLQNLPSSTYNCL